MYFYVSKNHVISVLGNEAPARQGEHHPCHWQVGRLHAGRDQAVQSHGIFKIFTLS
jgi:hypothetical protein